MDKICRVEGCNGKYYGLGYCSKHWQQFKKHGESGIDKYDKKIAVCKNPQCNNEFIILHRRHFYCCDVCKYTHHNSTEKHKESMRSFNKSAKGKARTKRYLQSEKGKIYNQKKSTRQRQKNPVKLKARLMAAWHLESYLPCSVEGCGQPGERHHEDYNDPLRIVYLCKQHHMDLHNNRLCLN